MAKHTARAIAGLMLTACGGASTHHQSAAAACKDFVRWYLEQDNNVFAGKDKALLAHAVSEAPSGHLHRDLSTFESSLQTAPADQINTSESGLAVVRDCQKVNPNS